MNLPQRTTRVVAHAFARFWRERTWRLAASITFYVLLTLGPLLAMQLRLAGMLVGEDAYRDQVLKVIENAVGDEGADAVENLLDNFSLPESGWISYFAGFWILLFGGINAMAQLRNSLRLIWGEEESEPMRNEASRSPGFQMAMDMGFVFVFNAVLLASVLLNSLLVYARSALDDAPGILFLVIRLLDLGLALLLLSALFAAIYRILPARRMPWRRVWFGAAVTAVLFSLGRYGVILWVSRANLDSVYGSLTFFIVLTTWVYVSAQLLLFGGCLTHELHREAGDSGG